MIRLYRLLLWLYPAGFRREYGPAMAELFADRAAQTGALGRVGLLLSSLVDIATNALALHWEMLRHDLRYTGRTLRRAPGFAFTIIVVTAIGVGANTAAFSVADFVLLRPLAFPQFESLVRLCEGPRTGPSGWGCMNQFSPANFRDFRERTTSFAAMGAFFRNAVNLVDTGEPQRIAAASVTADVMPLLGVQPYLGTLLDTAVIARDARSVVISYGLWQSRFGGESTVLGRSLRLDGIPHIVIGVMPASFHFPTRDAQIWMPLQLPPDQFENRGNSFIEGIARLKDGVTFEQAHADLRRVAEQLAREYPETNEETGVSFFRVREEFSPRFKLMLQALCGASLCILLLACANLGNLLLARAGVREREMAVRAALGAGKERLVRQMITESVALAALGGVAGIALSILTLPLLSLLVPNTLPIATQPNLNLRMLALAALFTALTGLGFGLVPALRAGSRAALSALRGGRARPPRQHLRSVLVGVEVAVSVVLLIGAGLLIRAMMRVEAVDPGFRAESVLTVRTVLPKPAYDSVMTREQFYRAVLNEVRALPGVRAAAYASGLPMVLTGGIARVVLPGQEIQRDGQYSVSRRYVSSQFFSALGIPLVAGRDFEEGDADNRRKVAVVSESFVQRYWPEGDPLGKSFLFFDSLHTVVGVVGDIKVRGLERTSEPQLYLPTTRISGLHEPKELAIRVTGEPMALLPAIREIVRKADPDQPISDVTTLADILALQTASRAAQVKVLLALAMVAVLLAGLGIYGVLAYAVTQRRGEIGVRLALGAEPRQIARRVVWDGLSIVLLALLPGLMLGLFAARFLNPLLFGVAPNDPTTIAGAIGLCLGMSIIGAVVPALRAVRVSPMSVMRTE